MPDFVCLVCACHVQVSSYKEDSDEAMKELLNFIFLACGAPSTEGPYEPPAVIDVASLWYVFLGFVLLLVARETVPKPVVGLNIPIFSLLYLLGVIAAVGSTRNRT